jgi:hypothetical protein
VTKLPPRLEATVPLAFVSPDALAYAVAMSLKRYGKRVGWWTGRWETGDAKLNFDDGLFIPREPLFAEYVPAGTVVGVPETVQ